MNVLSRLLVASCLCIALVSAAGCTTSTCDPACASGQTCDVSTSTCVAESTGCKSSQDCSGTTPVCDVTVGQCVGCLADADCATGICDTSTHTCPGPQCRSNADCSADAGFADEPFCTTEGQCVQCRSDADCTEQNGVRATCDVGTSMCISNPCMTDQDCSLDSSAPHCNATTGGCVQCTEDAECTASAPHCLPTGTCGQCLVDADCDTAIGQTCDTASFSCVVTACVTDAECAGAQRCQLMTGACVQCLTSADCWFGGTCMANACVNPSSCASDSDCLVGSFCVSSACVSCRSASDCADGQTCSSAGACQAPSTCTTSAMCLAGQTCTGGVCATASCSSGLMTPNQTASTANLLPAGTTSTVSATVCPNESDYYTVALPAGSGAIVSVTSASASPALSLNLFVGPGNLTQVTGTSNQSGVVSAQITSAPTGSEALLMQVGGGDGQVVNYTLSVQTQAGGLCAQTGSPDTTIAEAPTVMPGMQTGMLCPGSEAWYAVNVPANNRLTVSFTSNAPAQGVAVEIRAMNAGAPVVDSYAETDATGAVTVTSNSVAPTGGEMFWVQLYNLGVTQIAWSANIGLLAQAPPNNECVNATPLDLQDPNNGYLQGAVNTLDDTCGGTGGDSYWTLTVTEPEQVTVSLTADFPVVMSFMGACDGTGEIGCTSGSSGSESLSFQGLEPGTYIVRVAGAAAGDAGNYTLTVQTSPAPPPTVATCAEPISLAFTGMDSSGNPQASASGNIALAANNVTSACGQAGGDAVYTFTLTMDQQIVASLAGFPGVGLTLVPVGSCLTPSSGGTCVTSAASGTATVTQNVATAGTYALIVDGGNAVSGQFTLTVTQLPPLYPPSNNTCTSPTEISQDGTYPGTTVGAVDAYDPPSPMCGTGTSSGSVVYHFNLATPQAVSLQLAAEFQAAMTVLGTDCSGGAFVNCATGANASLSLPDLPGGDYYVWIDGYSGDAGTFTLTKTTTAAQMPPPNETCATATPVDLSGGMVTETGSTALSTNTLDPTDCLQSGSTTPLTLAGPDVVYSVSIPAGGTLSASMDPTDFNGTLIVVDSCTDNTCLAAADHFFVPGNIEAVTVPNTGSSAETVYVIVTSYSPQVSGDFTLTMQVQ